MKYRVCLIDHHEYTYHGVKELILTSVCFMSCLGLDQDAAKDTLEMCNYDFNAAVNILFDDQAAIGGSSSATTTSTTTTDTDVVAHENLIDNDDNVRAPIPSKRELLITPESDNFQSRRRKIVVSRNVCPLRNFEMEGRLQEQQMEAITNPESNGRIKRTAHVAHSSYANEPYERTNGKRSRLEYLYRPPVDICFSGSLQAARDYARMRNRWLIVNLQDNGDFKCQLLNRDLWSNESVRSLLKEHFIFWQVAIDNSDGMRFKSFYNVDKLPFVCILDPTTGEKKISYSTDNELMEDAFRKELYTFLTLSNNHPTSPATVSVS